MSRVVFIMPPGEAFTPIQTGALATNVFECCRGAQKRGFEPLVISRSTPHPTHPGVETHFVEHPPEPRNAFSIASARLERKIFGWSQFGERVYAQRVARLLARQHLHALPLILHNNPGLAVVLRRRFPHAFILHRFHNQLECKPRIQRQFAASASAVACVSDFTRQWIETYYQLHAPVFKGPLRAVHNGVDCEKFRPAPQAPAGVPIINFVGRTGREKAPDTLLRAALLLSRRTREFGLQIVGSNYWHKFELDDYQRELRELCRQLESAGIAVRQPGHINRDELPQEFHKAHIHVVPSRWDEPFGLTTVEGMASGLATVASNTGGSPEILRGAGLLFERDNVEQLAEHLHALVSDAALRRAVAQRCRRRAEEFSWDKTWAGLESLLPLEKPE